MAQLSPHPLVGEIDALTFDVFGTTVDWRSSVETRLKVEADMKLASADLSPELRTRLQALTAEDWAKFADEWRGTYYLFTESAITKNDANWKDIDTHHHESLIALLDKWQLDSLYTADEIQDLSRVWHFLTPWPDSAQGIHALGTKFTTATLSNGNQAILKDLDAFGSLGFKKFISAADYGVYKPSPESYKGAAATLGVPIERVAMVACHLGDLVAARSVGMRSIYVERLAEEAWGVEEDRYKQGREGADIWLTLGEGGFVEVARRLGVTIDATESLS